MRSSYTRESRELRHSRARRSDLAPEVTDPRADFLSRAARGGVVPLAREIVLDADTAVAAYAKIARPPFGFLLESLVGRRALGALHVPRHRAARGVALPRPRAWSAGRAADGWARGGRDGRSRSATWPRGCGPSPPVAGPGPAAASPAARWATWATTWCARSSACPRRPPTPSACPTPSMMIADSLVMLDNLYGRAIAVANVEVPADAPARERVAAVRSGGGAPRRARRRLAEPASPRRRSRCRERAAGPDATGAAIRGPTFERDVARVLEHMRAGDTFQTVLSRRQEIPAAVDPLRLYRFLRALNPAPYLFYLALDDFALVGSSPEVLVRVAGRRGDGAAHRRDAPPRRHAGGGRGAGAGAAGGRQGDGRAPHARGPGAQRRGARGDVRQRAGHRAAGVSSATPTCSTW